MKFEKGVKEDISHKNDDKDGSTHHFPWSIVVPLGEDHREYETI